MSLATQRRRVQQAEQALQARCEDTLAQSQRLGACWRANLTPGRVLLAGLAAGFLVGRARPFQLAGSSGVLAMLRSVSQLVAQVQDQVRAAAEAGTSAPTNAPTNDA